MEFIRTVSHITAAGEFVHDHMRMADLAAALGYGPDASWYRSRVSALKAEFHSAFYDPIKQMYGDGTLTAQGLALWLGVVPSSEISAVVVNLLSQIDSFGGHSAGIGFIGVRYLFEGLARVNQTDAALRMLLKTTYPGFGYEIANSLEPATSLWECFDGDTMHQVIMRSCPIKILLGSQFC